MAFHLLFSFLVSASSLLVMSLMLQQRFSYSFFLSMITLTYESYLRVPAFQQKKIWCFHIVFQRSRSRWQPFLTNENRLMRGSYFKHVSRVLFSKQQKNLAHHHTFLVVPLQFTCSFDLPIDVHITNTRLHFQKDRGR
jgi:hypothetical protein